MSATIHLCCGSSHPASGGPLMDSDTAIRVAASQRSDDQQAQPPVASDDSLATAANILKNQLLRAGIKSVAVSTNSADVERTNYITLLLRTQLPASLSSVARSMSQMNPEGYFIRSDGRKVLIVGNTSVAVRHGVYDYLEQLGFRYFQPGEEWEIIPVVKTIFPNYERLNQPDYHTRMLANGHGFLKNDTLSARFQNWADANRLGGFFQLNIGHIYQQIVANNKSEFEAHPEYFGAPVKKGEIPVTPKFNVANAGLVELVKRDALYRIKESARIGRPLMMLSMEPSDGSAGYCMSEACKGIGGISEQVFYLANEVARHLQKHHPGMLVGSFAYNEHILPPKFPMEKNVFVMVTNGFNRTQYTTVQLLQQWKKKLPKVGVYEYLNVYEWDNDMPGKPLASQLSFVKKSIKDYYRAGASAYLAETNVGWVNKGLGQYVVSKLLWNVDVNVDSLEDEYYNLCFGTVAPTVRKLYQSFATAPKAVLSDNLLAEWIDLIQLADRQNRSPQVAARLHHIKLYLHYLVLYKKLKANPTPALMTELLSFANRTMNISAFATVPVMASLPKSMGFPKLSYYSNPNQQWRKATSPVANSEADRLIAGDRSSLQVVKGLRLQVEAARFENSQLTGNTPAGSIKKPGVTFVGLTRFIVRINKQSNQNLIELMGGLSAKTNAGQPNTIKVYDFGLFQSIKAEANVLLLHEQRSMQVKESFSLASLKPGLYIIEVEDMQRAFNISMSGDLHYNVAVSQDLILQTSSVTGLNNMILFVPEGTSQFVINKTKSLRVQSPTGRILDFADNKNSSHVIEVKKGEAGHWLLFYQAGVLNLEGVPPYLGIDPQRYLKPITDSSN
ncbi:MAG: DUF4838 domain-containing protein [Chitinophagaceae bacterium]